MSGTTKPNRKLLPGQFAQAEYHRQDVIVTPEGGTTLDEMQSPQYWAHVAKLLRPFDRIEVRPADGIWWAELLVCAVEPFAVRVHVLRCESFGAPAGITERDVAPGYTVKHRGREQWCVVRLSDNEVLRAKETSREGAVAWLEGHLRRLGETKQAA